MLFSPVIRFPSFHFHTIGRAVFEQPTAADANKNPAADPIGVLKFFTAESEIIRHRLGPDERTITDRSPARSRGFPFIGFDGNILGRERPPCFPAGRLRLL